MGPLEGVRIVDIGALASEQFAGMMLADMGAELIRVDRKLQEVEFFKPKFDLMNRGRRSIIVDLKKPGATEVILRLVDKADGLIEGFRSGVMERLGLGPDICIKRNPRLVYGRITGWGQEGPLTQVAAHDINYLAMSGALHCIGPQGGAPVPPLNYVGDTGGGGLFLAYGMVCALYEAQRSGKGQVVDAAMVDGSSVLQTQIHSFRAAGMWRDERGVNIADGGAHFHSAYETADGKWISVGCVEPKFYKLLLKLMEIDDTELLEDQYNREKWSELKKKLAAVFKKKTRDEWCEILEGTDACFAPVLTMGEAMEHPYNVARDVFVEVNGIKQPAPAPRFSRTKCEIKSPPPEPGEDTEEALKDWGFTVDEIESLKKAEIIGTSQKSLGVTRF